MTSTLAPICLFVYARLVHTQRTVRSLIKNSQALESELYVFSDGAKSEVDRPDVDAVRRYIHEIEGFKNVSIYERSENVGLAESITSGIDQILKESESVIVLEDDMICSPFFLEYMNGGLSHFKNVERVISIHGYVYPIKRKLPEAFFLRGADCWGWATWRRGWDLFNRDGEELLRELSQNGLEDDFDFDGSYAYVKMLKDQINGRNDSWAIRWHASAFLANKLTLYPGISLIENIGNDDTGTHCGDSSTYSGELSDFLPQFTDIDIEESSEARSAFVEFFRTIHKKSVLQSIFAMIKRVWIKF